LFIKSNKPKTIKNAKHMNINVHQKFTRKEIDIVKELGGFCYAKIKSIHKFIIICQNIK